MPADEASMMTWIVLGGLVSLVGITLLLCFALARAAAVADERLAMSHRAEDACNPAAAASEPPRVVGMA